MKVRLDQLLVDRGLFESRERAKSAIMSGIIFIEDRRYDKPGTRVDDDVTLDIRGNTLKYVSRGGLKLEKAIEVFKLNLDGALCADIGASTGGFTDCMLQNGAASVYAIDVGYGQLAWKLRTDDRVVVMERTNIRYVTPDDITAPLDFISIDVSFISLNLVLPVVRRLLKNSGEVVALVKPQFEAGREQVGKKGVVRDPEIHLQVLDRFCKFSEKHGFSLKSLSYSPIKGPEGNIEYLAHLDLSGSSATPDLRELIECSHADLRGT